MSQSAFTPLETQHIAPGCRDTRGDFQAWTEAVARLRQVYETQVARDPDATISVALYVSRPS